MMGEDDAVEIIVRDGGVGTVSISSILEPSVIMNGHRLVVVHDCDRVIVERDIAVAPVFMGRHVVIVFVFRHGRTMLGT